MIAEHCKEDFSVNRKVYVVCLDLLKAFENVNWKVMMKILKMIQIDYRDRRIVRELYKHQKTFTKNKRK